MLGVVWERLQGTEGLNWARQGPAGEGSVVEVRCEQRRACVDSLLRGREAMRLVTQDRAARRQLWHIKVGRDSGDSAWVPGQVHFPLGPGPQGGDLPGLGELLEHRRGGPRLVLGTDGQGRLSGRVKLKAKSQPRAKQRVGTGQRSDWQRHKARFRARASRATLQRLPCLQMSLDSIQVLGSQGRFGAGSIKI